MSYIKVYKISFVIYCDAYRETHISQNIMIQFPEAIPTPIQWYRHLGSVGSKTDLHFFPHFFNQVFQRKTLVIKMMNVGCWAGGRQHFVSGA